MASISSGAIVRGIPQTHGRGSAGFYSTAGVSLCFRSHFQPVQRHRARRVAGVPTSNTALCCQEVDFTRKPPGIACRRYPGKPPATSSSSLWLPSISTTCTCRLRSLKSFSWNVPRKGFALEERNLVSKSALRPSIAKARHPVSCQPSHMSSMVGASDIEHLA